MKVEIYDFDKTGEFFQFDKTGWGFFNSNNQYNRAFRTPDGWTIGWICENGQIG